MQTLSVVILTRDEEQHLPDCLASVGWASEVIVLDSFSADRTAEIAQASGARFEQHPFRNYADQRNVGLSLARGTWVLFVDADERVSDPLRAEIQQLLADDVSRQTGPRGYWIPRQNSIFGAWVRHTGWYPDHQLRLMERAFAQYDPTRPVHELVQMQGETGVLSGHLVHLNYETIREFVRKQRQYARFDAMQLRADGKRARPHNFVLQPAREFRRRLLTLEGFRDGWRGWALSALMAWYTLEVYRLLAAEQKTGGPALVHPS